MSVGNEQAPEPEPTLGVQAATAVSLEDRMAVAARGEALATSERFPIPGWSSFCWVELGVLNPDQQQAAADKCERIRPAARQNLAVAAQTLLAATRGFFEVTGEDTFEPYDTNWTQIGAVVHGMKEATPRQALIRVVGAENMLTFYGSYVKWMMNERERINAKQAKDFPATA